MKQLVPAVFLVLSIATLAVAQISTGGAKSGIAKQLEQFNADVAAWNKRCKVTKTPAEDAWCKKERARIDAKRAELVAAGAIPR